ncbi:MAG TPA: prepilin-type N-terminal cleavage/methylation domain-containing protein [Gemmatimonadaceae bacterium]
MIGSRFLRSGRRRGRGFTLAEVLVTVALLAVLAGVTIPAIMSRLTNSKGQALARELSNLGAGLRSFNSDLGTYPRYLNMLYSITDSVKTYCSTDIPLVVKNLTDGQQDRWRGPYVSRVITGDYAIDAGTVLNKVKRDATDNPITLQVTVTGVSSDIATAAEETIDGPGGNFSSGFFRWDGADASYRIAVPSSCL